MHKLQGAFVRTSDECREFWGNFNLAEGCRCKKAQISSSKQLWDWHIFQDFISIDSGFSAFCSVSCFPRKAIIKPTNQYL
jgi:hypothetical protein